MFFKRNMYTQIFSTPSGIIFTSDLFLHQMKDLLYMTPKNAYLTSKVLNASNLILSEQPPLEEALAL